MPGDKGFRYVYSPNHIINMLQKIRTAGRPDKLTFPYIRDTWLFKNAQYTEVLPILKDMEFINASGNPTELYAEYQNPSLAKKALAKGIRNAYSELFKAYPDAQLLPKEQLEGYFRQQTGKAQSVLDKILSTFQNLCNNADFIGTGVAVGEPSSEETKQPFEESRVKFEPRIQLNIEIHIAPDTDDDKIETIFKNMRRYLLDNE
jgi:hypothetical protein